MVNLLEAIFPGLAGGDYQVTSPRDNQYNCIAWAAGATGTFWWPGPNEEDEYWLPGVTREVRAPGKNGHEGRQGYWPGRLPLQPRSWGLPRQRS
jgi:hypothetical protein